MSEVVRNYSESVVTKCKSSQEAEDLAYKLQLECEKQGYQVTATDWGFICLKEDRSVSIEVVP